MSIPVQNVNVEIWMQNVEKIQEVLTKLFLLSPTDDIAEDIRSTKISLGNAITKMRNHSNSKE